MVSHGLALAQKKSKKSVNYPVSGDDSPVMEHISSACADIRPSLSAQVDGELLASAETKAVTLHLENCHACRAWMTTITAQRRAHRVGAAVVPDLIQPTVSSIMFAFDERSRQTRITPVPMIRVALAVIAGAMMVGATGTMFLADAHIPRELGGFEAALACGFFLAAWRPRHAATMSVVGSVAAVVLILTAIGDSTAGTTSSGLEANHFLDILGAFLTVALTRLTPASLHSGEPRLNRSGGSHVLPLA
jgi:predicted anti-sigma-YlaC factor YlaD